MAEERRPMETRAENEQQEQRDATTTLQPNNSEPIQNDPTRRDVHHHHYENCTFQPKISVSITGASTDVSFQNSQVGPISVSSVVPGTESAQQICGQVLLSLRRHLHLSSGFEESVQSAIRQRNLPNMSSSTNATVTEGNAAAGANIPIEEITMEMERVSLGPDIEIWIKDALLALVNCDESEISTSQLHTAYEEERASIEDSIHETRKDLKEVLAKLWEEFYFKVAAEACDRLSYDDNVTKRALARLCAELSRRIHQRNVSQSNLDAFVSRAYDFTKMGWEDFASVNKDVHAIFSFHISARLYKKAGTGDGAVKDIDSCTKHTYLVIQKMAKREDAKSLIVDHLIPLMIQQGEFIQSIPNSSKEVRIDKEAWCKCRIGLCYYFSGEYRKCAEESEAAIRILCAEFKNPETRQIYGRCLLNIGVANIKLKRATEARRFCKRALEAYKEARDWESDDEKDKFIVSAKKNLKVCQALAKK